MTTPHHHPRAHHALVHSLRTLREQTTLPEAIALPPELLTILITIEQTALETSHFSADRHCSCRPLLANLTRACRNLASAMRGLPIEREMALAHFFPTHVVVGETCLDTWLHFDSIPAATRSTFARLAQFAHRRPAQLHLRTLTLLQEMLNAGLHPDAPAALLPSFPTRLGSAVH